MTERHRVIGFLFVFGLLFALGLSTLLRSEIKIMGDDLTEELDADRLERTIQWLTISNPRDWSSTVATGNRVVFLNCEWNMEVVKYRHVFARFAPRRRSEANYNVAIVMMDENDKDEVSQLACRLVNSSQIAYGLKTLYGAGLVLWLKDGKVVENDWCPEYPNEQSLLDRTAKLFGE